MGAGAALEARAKAGENSQYQMANTDNPIVRQTSSVLGSGGTPLHGAAGVNENPAVIRVLLEARAVLEARMKNGWTPCMWQRHSM